MNNNLVQTPVRKNQINNIIHSINKGLCRPTTYSYMFEGSFNQAHLNTSYVFGYIPLSTKLNPTIVYEIVAVGRMPNHDHVLLNYNETPLPTVTGTIMPYCILHGVASVPDGANNSNGYSSKGNNPLMEIFVGSTVIEKPEFSTAAVTAVNALSQTDPWHLDIGLTLKGVYGNVVPSYDNYKGDFSIPSVVWPTFMLNVTVYYEQGIKI